ncbi:MAG: 50S ribosomal protein L13 [Buchnera aphidicola (Periphyllus acericola)]|uniref:50S ribosomal protein L13 n=1 Tax=Buchnera aphidicola TaxID=9 RepID=UPI0030D3FF37|nr:50S ribosomal protein L13 [Buchnera aphidicola (Periphyllus acericola)]
MKSFSISSKNIIKNWYYINANGKILGRLSSIISHYLRGKHKEIYTPYMDVGDYIIVLNASKICVTGKKNKKKLYHRYTGHVGGLKTVKFSDMIKNNPEQVIKKSVYGMLPKGPLGRIMFKKLKVYRDEVHNHHAQKPILLKI